METFAKNSRPFGGRQAEEGQKHLEADLEAQLSLFKQRNSAKKMTARIRTGLDQLRQVLNQFFDPNIIRDENDVLSSAMSPNFCPDRLSQLTTHL
jgi:hypothetical protein